MGRLVPALWLCAAARVHTAGPEHRKTAMNERTAFTAHERMVNMAASQDKCFQQGPTSRSVRPTAFHHRQAIVCPCRREDNTIAAQNELDSARRGLQPADSGEATV
jgi:hypothetical protein